MHTGKDTPGELTIGQVATASGVNVQTLRFYERRGILPRPPRSRGNYRVYHVDAVRRVRFVKGAQNLGFSLREIKDLLSLRARPGERCVEVRRRAEAKLEEIDAKMQSLRAIRKALAKVLAECCGTMPATDSSILESLKECALCE
jgi:MerR family mercuric resistance operon transcriptional regulator